MAFEKPSEEAIAGLSEDRKQDQTQMVRLLRERFGSAILAEQETRDSFPTLWVTPEHAVDLLQFLKNKIARPYRTLFDLTAIDERTRIHRAGQPAGRFSVVYHLLSYDRNDDLRIKVPLEEEYPSLPTATTVWPAADWYEREVWDMFGIRFDGHPNLRRILMPTTWKGHPLRKEHPARATEMGPFELPDARQDAEQAALQFNPEEWGMKHRDGDTEYMFVNIGPQHPATHGVLRTILQLDGEVIHDAVVDIGFHHRGAEKMGERQTWHTYLPYSDRVDYLGGVMNNMAYCLAVEKLAGIEVPDRVKVIRIMLSELFRISSHLVWYGTFAADLGAMTPVFFMFVDREKIFDIIEAICGDRMHPNWFRIGGVAQDLPKGWEQLVRTFLDHMPKRLDEYHNLVLKNRIVRMRTQGIGAYTKDQAIEWGVTGPNLRACGIDWDFRKKRPYSGYDQFEFDIPLGKTGDCYDRALVRSEEIRQSLRIIEQCMKNMPDGPYKADHPLTTPPLKERTLEDIETLINHFVGVSWGPVIPPGEACFPIEATKGCNSYYLVSDGNTGSYRTRVRTPSFAHVQTLPMISRGLMISDYIAILAAIDYLLSDLDR